MCGPIIKRTGIGRHIALLVDLYLGRPIFIDYSFLCTTCFTRENGAPTQGLQDSSISGVLFLFKHISTLLCGANGFQRLR